MKNETSFVNKLDAISDWIGTWSTPEPTTYQGSGALPFQRWFKFKEAFSPTLVQSIIESLPHKPERVLDCCAGSGTTGVVAQFCGLGATLVEVNPFLADLIQAKLDDYEGIELHLELARVLDRAASATVTVDALRTRLPPTFVEPGVNGRWIFDRTVAKEVERLRLAIDAGRKPRVRKFFTVALASILIGLSNVRIDGKGRRYRQNWGARSFTASDVRERFLAAVTLMAQDIYRHSHRKQGSARVICGDARVVLPQIKEPIGLALFSPPYPNSFDYTDIYNVELWMLGYLTKSSDNTELRRRTLRSHVQVSWELPSGLVNCNDLNETIRQLNEKRSKLWDRRLPQMVHAYFEDMYSLIAGMQGCLTPDARIAIVVGDSSYSGVRIDSAKIISNIARQLGWELERKTSARVMRASMQHNLGVKALDEWLLIFRRAGL